MKNLPLKLSRLIFILICIALTGNTNAADLQIDLGLGSASLTNEDYGNTFFADGAIGIAQSGFQYRAGTLIFDDFRPSNSSNDAHIEIKGHYLLFAKEFDLNPVLIDVGIGGVFSKTEAYFSGRLVADENDTSPILNVKILKEFTRSYAMHFDWKYIDDLSGGDLHLFQVGVRFTF